MAKEILPVTTNIIELPVLPLRDVVVYPHMVIPLFVGRKKSITALEAAMLTTDQQILLSAQKNAAADDPELNEIYKVGTIARVLQLLKLPDGTVKVLVEGVQRGLVKQYVMKEEFITAQVEPVVEVEPENREVEILSRSLVSQFDQYVKLNKKIDPNILSSLASIEESGRLADMIAAHLALKIDEKQRLLESIDLQARLEILISFLETEIDLMHLEKRIRGRVKRQMEKSQREYYLNEQMKAIQKELGELGDEPNELEDLETKITKAGMPKEVKEKALSELRKLKMMSPMSAEATVLRNYLDWMIKTPWKAKSKVSYDIAKAQAVLDTDHYGLEKVKERILEYLAVEKRVKKIRGAILCLVGPPGVGKTSLGQSIAKATGRQFVRIALGGVRDEAEIRGHRRTYIGSMPGKIIQKLAKVGVRNPIIMLDEVDKMAMDFRGDPAAALLEVLDPEQNHTFADHYLEVDYDLTDVMFIATANSLEIPPALLDRMEVIRLPGYTEIEKCHISLNHLVPKQLAIHGLTEKDIDLQKSAVVDIIRYYTREAGVRNLERDISKICRKVVKEIDENTNKKNAVKPVVISESNVEKYLGVHKFRYGIAEKDDRIGQVTGLAWTSVGGEILTIEASVVPGKGKATYTGQLGEVMQESIQAAMTVIRSRSNSLGLSDELFERKDIHVHVPEGATPKDGPSAGISMYTALASALTGIPVRADVAMTGEITLRGEVLPIGGLKEKLIAALRGNIKHVIIPSENERDLIEIPAAIKDGLKIHPVRWVDQVMEIALKHMPVPIEAKVDVVLPIKKTKSKKDKSGTSAH